LREEIDNNKYDNVFITQTENKCVGSGGNQYNKQFHIEKQMNSVERLSEDVGNKILSNVMGKIKK